MLLAAPFQNKLQEIEERYYHFMDQPIIQSFLKRGGRVFIATENVPIEIIQRWIDLGHRHFSEKYVQETQLKWPLLQLTTPDIVLHQYGHLQSNKLNKALELYDGLESLDRVRLARKLAQAKAQPSRLRDLWVQVNLGAEPQKSGVLLRDLDAFMESCRMYQLPIRGFMAIPPKKDPPFLHFQKLNKLKDTYQLGECIMGMSADYALAIEMGSSLIRVKRTLLPSIQL